MPNANLSNSASNGLPSVIDVLMSLEPKFISLLAVAVRSLLENIRGGVYVRLYLLHEGIDDDSRTTIESSWEDFPIKVSWIAIDSGAISKRLKGGTTAWRATYYYLLLGDVLPQDVDRVLVADADLLFVDDPTPLFVRPLAGAVLAAVRDPFLPVFGAQRFAVSVDSSLPYFNAGLMLVDVQAWRREKVGLRTLALAEQWGENNVNHDQDPLNFLLIGKWMEIEPRWNALIDLERTKDWRLTPYGKKELEDAIRTPAIVHFSGQRKPMSPYTPSAHLEKYREVAARTQFPLVSVRRSAVDKLLHWAIGQPMELFWTLTRIEIAARSMNVDVTAVRRRRRQVLLQRPWLLLQRALNRVLRSR